MPSLSEFGGGVDDADLQTAPSRSTVFSHGRCEAVIGDGHSIRRCQNGARRGKARCHQHEDDESQLTIHSPASDLIRLSGRRAGLCRARKGDGDRCTYSTTATEILCQTHQDANDPDIVEPNAGELDQEVIHDALAALEEAAG